MEKLESKLWLAFHLLYPSAGQAGEAYELVLRQNAKLIREERADLLFQKVISIFEKIPALTANLSFYEFDHESVEIWRLVYRDSHKTQLFAVIGALILDLSPKQMASSMSATEEKILFLLQQVFRKLITSTISNRSSEPLQNKKHQENRVSYLFTYENLVAFALGYLDEEENERVKVGLELYPILKTDYNEYRHLADRIRKLQVLIAPPKTREFSSRLQIVPSISLSETNSTTKKSSRNANFYLFLMLASGFCLVFGIKFVSSYFNEDKAELVEVVTMEKPKREVSANETDGSSTNLTAKSQDIEVKIVQSSKEHDSLKPGVDTKLITKSSPATHGGLYRGTLNLKKDIKSVNSELQSQLVKLGAIKAGEVELGWMKSKNVAYYHYTIPEKAVRDAGEILGKLGELKIKFENHPRQISSNERRFIIEVQGLSVQ